MKLRPHRSVESFSTFEAAFPDENACVEHLFRVRFGPRPVCQICARVARWRRVPRARAFRSRCCGQHVSVAMGTFLAHTQISLKQFFYAVYLISLFEGRLSANAIARQVGVSSVSGVSILDRIRAHMSLLSMTQRSEFSGKVYVDEMRVRCDASGAGRRATSAIVFGVTDGERYSLYCVPNRKAATLRDIVVRAIAPGTRIVADSWRSYNCLTRYGYSLSRLNHRRGEWKNRAGDSTAFIETCWREVRERIDRVHKGVPSANLWKYLGQLQFFLNCRSAGLSPFWTAIHCFPPYTREALTEAKGFIDRC